MVSDGTRLREEFLLDPSVTFLNHGSFGATPRAVFERYQEWQLELERQPVLFLARRLDGLLAETRAALGAGIGLLVADWFSPEQRRAIGWTLLAMGGLTTVPLAFEVLGGRPNLLECARGHRCVPLGHV